MRRPKLALAAMLAALATASLAAPAAAHPLGNATVSRGVAVGLASDAVVVDYVVDMAEIPAFAAMQGIDTDADGAVSADEAAAYARAACAEAVGGLALEVDGQPLALTA
ncbi:MAG: nickel transporter, partial [Candidatus Limnocylindria bacterium]